MNTEILEMLEEMWPNKFSDREAKRFAARFQSEPIGVIAAALERFKDRSRFIPKIPEIERIIGAMENEAKRKEGPQSTEPMSFVQTIRASRAASDRPIPEGLDDWEVIAGYWRGQWLRYWLDANRRRNKIGIDPRTRFRIDSPSVHKALADHDRQVQGQKSHVEISCRGCLIAEWFPEDWAEFVVDAIAGTNDKFNEMLEQLKANVKGLRIDAENRKKEAAEQEFYGPPTSEVFQPVPSAPDPQAQKVKILGQVKLLEASQPETAGAL